MEKTILLSDGEPCTVRVLGIFELDAVAPAELPEPYYYEYEMAGGQMATDVYDPFKVPTPPEEPEVPKHECEKNSIGFFQWQEYETYKAALVHWEQIYTRMEQYSNDVAMYILENCISGAERERLITPEDWFSVQKAALVPQVTEEVLADTIRRSFPGDV